MSHRVSADAQPSWFGQPRGLTILFLTEMWEQFSLALPAVAAAGMLSAMDR